MPDGDLGRSIVGKDERDAGGDFGGNKEWRNVRADRWERQLRSGVRRSRGNEFAEAVVDQVRRNEMVGGAGRGEEVAGRTLWVARERWGRK